MRILHTLASPVFSGPAENVALLAVAQRALGHEVTVAVDRRRPGLSAEEPIVPRLRAFGLLDETGLELSVKSPPWNWVRDALALRARKVDVVHAHFSHDHQLARWSRGSGLLVRSVHAPRSFRGLPRARGYTVPSTADLRRLPRGAPARVLPPLLGPEFTPPPDRAALQEELGLEGAPLIGMASTLQASRRHLLALEAFALLHRRVPSARLVIVGDGVMEPTLRERARALRLEPWITFAGYRSGVAFARSLKALDELWILGLGNDWSGRLAAQGRAVGARVISVDEGGLGENADRLLPSDGLTPEVICLASLDAENRSLTERRGNEAIARDVLELYAEASAA